MVRSYPNTNLQALDTHFSYLVMVSLGEMAAYLPHRKGFAGYASRFVDPALGFALGWSVCSPRSLLS
jgi:amino acid permease